MFFLISCNGALKKEDFSQNFKTLNALVADLDYFKLQQEFQHYKYQISKKDSLYFEAILANAFNAPERSNRAIDAFFEIQHGKTNDTLDGKMLHTKLTNFIYLFQYSKALEINETLQKRYAFFLDSTKMNDLTNTHKIWKALANVPAHEVIITADVTMTYFQLWK